MGVKKLWQILEPTGRRVDIATLRGKTLAIDVSIWLVSFSHAMRDRDGHAVPHAHLLGTFRRVVKLLFHRIRPVFVFDGGAPALKRRTLLLRQQQRESQEARHAQALRRLLLQQLRQRQLHAAGAAAENPFSTVSLPSAVAPQAEPQQPIAGEDPQSDPSGNSSGSDGNGPATGAATLKRLRKGPAKVRPEAQERRPSDVVGQAPKPPRPNRFASVAAFGDEDDSDGSGAGMFDDSVPVLPEAAEDADLGVVASLPPHMQFEYVEGLKRRYRAGTRSKLLPVAADPEAFARAQLSSFLRVAKFNSAVDRLNAAQAGSVASGHRIASEADRKYLLYDDSVAGNPGGSDGEDGGGSGGGFEAHDDVLPSLAAPKAPLPASTSVSAAATAHQQGLSDRDRLRLFVGGGGFRDAAAPAASAAYRPSNGGWRGSGRGRGRGRGARDRLAERISASIPDAERAVAFIEGRGSGRGGALSNYYEQLLRASTATASTPLDEDETGVAAGSDSGAANSQETPAVADPSDGADEEMARAIALSLRPRDETCPDGCADGDNVAGTSDDSDAGGFFAEEPSVGSVDRKQADRSSGRSPHQDTSERAPVSDRHCIAGTSDDALGGTLVSATSEPSLAAPSVGSVVLEGCDEDDEEWEDANGTINGSMPLVRMEVSLDADIDATSPARAQSPRAEGVTRVLSHKPEAPLAAGVSREWAADERPAASHSPPAQKEEGVEQGEEAGANRAAGPPARSEDTAIAEAFELAGLMRSGSMHAFASAMKSLGRSIPIVAAERGGGEGAEGVGGPVERASAGSAPPAPVVSAAARKRDAEPELAELEAAEARLRDDIRGAARSVDTVSETMKEEVMALLRLCGVPFVIAPMEAEAQCAALELAGLVEGVVTDDSDAFLFGSSVVYRNIFDDSKFVEVYQAADVSRELGLSRDDLIRLALLLGSDYTEGVRGIGPVNACEVLRAFPGDGGLVAFREWLHSVQPEPELSRVELAGADPTAAFKAAHRAGRRSWQVSDSFPNAAVLASYRRPAVRELPVGALSWALPDLEGLRLLCQERFAWPRDRADAELLPMMRELTSGAVQASIAPYLRSYDDGDRAARIRSVRLRTAVEGITGVSAAEIALQPGAPPGGAAAAAAAAAAAKAPRKKQQARASAAAAAAAAGGREEQEGEARGAGEAAEPVRAERGGGSARASRLPPATRPRASARKRRRRVLRSLSSSSSDAAGAKGGDSGGDG